MTTLVALAGVASTGTARAEEAAPPRHMPAFVGKGLLQVYDKLGAGVRFDVEDIGGEHRSVLWPFNWKVCEQTPAAGALLASYTRVRVGVVQKTEDCPTGGSAQDAVR
ncbi:hypothetical protein ACGFW5_05025 [Streptomyces sp. NPDC048416]|uniref:hypothetical protein n=1 Tax=Streptomyces sp. NPDC048416 TaxID=3365546 RepID=UPI00371BD3AA